MRINLFRRATRMLTLQSQMIRDRDQLLRVYEKAILEHQRALLQMAVGFRVSLEMPEVDLRDELDQMIRDLEVGIALSEEHVV